MNPSTSLETIAPSVRGKAKDRYRATQRFPAKFDDLLATLACASANVVEVWRYAITMMLIGDEGAHIVATREQDDVLYLTVETDTGERFEVVRPPMSDETEQLLFQEIRKMMGNDGSGDGALPSPQGASSS